jgi:hypothetical protein
LRATTKTGGGALLMIDFLITWMLNNPLQGVAALAALSIVIGLVLIPGLHEIAGHGHPRV